MKVLFQILVIVMLATTSGSCYHSTSSPLTGPVTEEKNAGETPRDRKDNMEVARNTEKPPIPLSLPNKATVQLKDGDSRSGQVAGMDGQKLIIKKGSSRPSLPIDQIDHVKLEGDIWWPNSTGYFVIRGEDTPAEGKNKVFLVGMDGFEWENSERGIARIEPEAVMEVDGRSGIPGAMRRVILRGDSRYVVSEMRFIPEERQMEITATAKLRQPEN